VSASSMQHTTYSIQHTAKQFCRAKWPWLAFDCSLDRQMKMDWMPGKDGMGVELVPWMGKTLTRREKN